MTTYGTIPTESLASLNQHFVPRAKEQIQSALSNRRPWQEIIQLQNLTLPSTFNQSVHRIKTNVVFFRMNYAIITFSILFLSLLWHPISLIVLIVMMVAWIFLFFLHDQPLMILGYRINLQVVMMALLVVTLVALYLTNARYHIVAGLCIGLAVVLVHGALREPEDVFVVDDEGPGSGGGGAHVHKVPHK
ncbi:PRA1 family protein F2-like [Pyrus x bretschneideri]|uniref:PRA1 family protein F2-like n=1 Tax=Pyrus x bretschneideri TaxID=225117 RepID=UPI00202DBA14|nr:PRA1 family protein F2-like [Pyrus x bretschneideri]